MAGSENQQEQQEQQDVKAWKTWIEELRSDAKKTSSKKIKLKLLIILGAFLLVVGIGFGIYAIFSNVSNFYKITQGTSLSSEVDTKAYRKGEEVTLTADYEIDGYRFVYWEVDGEKGSDKLEIKFIIDDSSPKSYVAVYKMLYDIRIDDEIEEGFVTTNKQVALKDEEVEVIVSLPNNYIITGLKYALGSSLNVIRQNQSNKYIFRMPEGDITILADIEKTSYDIVLPESQTGYTLVTSDDELFDITEINRGGSISFKIELNEAYTKCKDNIIVKSNGIIVSPINGLYSIRWIRENITITVEGVSINKYTIRYLNHDEDSGEDEVYMVKELEYGSDSDPGTPIKNPSNYYTYSFTNWDKDFAIVYSDATYIAYYTKAIREYSLTIGEGVIVKQGENILTSENTLHYDDIITVDLDTPEEDMEVNITGVEQVPSVENTYKVTADIVVQCTLQDIKDISYYPNLTFELNTSAHSATVRANQSNYPKDDLVIPNKVKKNGATYTVTTIAANGFSYCSNLVSVSIPRSITSIGSYAFYNCTSLEKVLASSVANWFNISFADYYSNPLSYAHNLFVGRNEITSITVPANVTRIYAYAFDGLTSLESVTFAENSQLTSIGDSAFYGCALIPSIELPNSVTTIGNSAFSGCQLIPTLNLPTSLKSIGDYAFSGCNKIPSLVLPSTLITIGKYAFNNCTSIKDITLQENSKLSSVDENAFQGCTGLSEGKVTINSTNDWLKITFVNSASNPLTQAKHLYVGEEEVTELVVDNAITKISDYAFYNCTSLESVTLAQVSQLKSIGKYAFYNCTNLTDFSLANTTLIESIGESAFSSCISLTNLSFENNSALKTIGNNAFTNCNNLSMLKISDIANWLKIQFGNENANPLKFSHSMYLSGGQEITVLDIPDGTQSINSYAFYGWSNVTDVTIPDSVTYIGENAFRGCGNIVCSTYDNAKYIGNSTNPYIILFKSVDTNITSCEINTQCKFIHSLAFEDCASITNIIVPSGVRSIGSGAFKGCSSLESMTLPFVGKSASLTSASESTLFGYIFGKSQYTNSTSVDQYYESSRNVRYYLPLSLRTITFTGENLYYGAFYGCSMLTTIVFSSNIKAISDRAFSNCSGLNRIVASSLSSWLGISFASETANPLYHAQHLFVNNSEITELTIPDGIEAIKQYAFYNCNGIVSVTLSSSVKSIGKSAFYKCSALTKIKLSTGLTSIGESAFYYCSALDKVEVLNTDHWFNIVFADYLSNPLYYAHKMHVGTTEKTTITVPSSVTTINSFAFYMWTALTSVTISNGVTTIGNSAFSGCSGLNSITIANTVTTIDEYAFNNCTALTTITIPTGVTNIKNSAFYGCTGLTKVVTPSLSDWLKITFESSTANPLYYAKKLYVGSSLITNLQIPSGTTSIKSYAFYNCTAITNVTMSAATTLTSIGASAFSGCSALENITMPSGLTSISSGAFSGCSALKKVTISNLANWFNITFSDSASNPLYYGHHLYIGTTERTELEIPTAVTSIKGYALVGASYITKITVPSSVTSIVSGAFSGCSGLVEISLPFVGGSQKTATVTNQFPFGYIFGETYYTGSTSVPQAFHESSTTTTSQRTYYIPSGLRKVSITGGNILYGAFSNCSMLTEIGIPQNITEISERAFYGCSKLTAISIPGTVTKLGKDAFNACSELANITFAGTTQLTTIEEGVFSGCGALTNIVIPDTVISIAKGVFNGCKALESITIPFVGGSVKTAEESDQYPFGYIFGETSYLGGTLITQKYIGSNSTIINGSYYIPLTLTTVRITGGNILYGAFYGCSMLTTIILPENTTTIGDEAFAGCVNLSSTKKYSNAYYMGTNANPYLILIKATSKTIANCTIANDCKYILDSAFAECSSLANIIIPNSVISIGENAFYSCGGLTSVTFRITNGWFVYDTTNPSDTGTEVALSNPADNAALLNVTYVNMLWKRNG